MKYYLYTRLFLSIVWKDFHGAKISIKSAHEVSKLVWLK